MASLRVNRDVIRIANKITGSAEVGRYFRMGMPILLIVFFEKPISALFLSVSEARSRFYRLLFFSSQPLRIFLLFC